MGLGEEEGHQPPYEVPHLAACSDTVGLDPFNNNYEQFFIRLISFMAMSSFCGWFG